MIMYESLKDWMKIPITIKPTLSVNDDGDVTSGVPKNTLCLAEDKLQVVVNREGLEVVSVTTLYIDGSEDIGHKYSISYNDTDYPIKMLGSVYEGQYRSLWLVYL
jgi:hypothetical protein